MDELEIVCPECQTIIRANKILMLLENSENHPDYTFEENSFTCPECLQKLKLTITVARIES